MTSKSTYFRGYRAAAVRRFGGLDEVAPAVRELPDDSLCYVTGEFDLVLDPLNPGESLLAGTPTSEWVGFCRDNLGFRVPEGV